MSYNETVDDVLADMLRPRFDAITAMRANNYDEIKSLVANYRDRLKAAWKRERERGDAAKLREALMHAEQVLDTAARNVRGETGMVINSAYSEAARKCRAALAAPPRNCDRFSVAAEALAEWQRLAHMKPNTWDFRYNYWLFAPATEQEGGDK